MKGTARSAKLSGSRSIRNEKKQNAKEIEKKKHPKEQARESTESKRLSISPS